MSFGSRLCSDLLGQLKCLREEVGIKEGREKVEGRNRGEDAYGEKGRVLYLNAGLTSFRRISWQVCSAVTPFDPGGKQDHLLISGYGVPAPYMSASPTLR